MDFGEALKILKKVVEFAEKVGMVKECSCFL